MKVKALFKPALLISAVALLSGLSACGATGYKTFSIKEGIQGFHFEYPAEYDIIRIDLANMSDSPYTNVGFGATYDGAISEIYIYIWPTRVGVETATAALNTLLANAAGVLSEFALETQIAVTVSGQSAQSAAFSAEQTDSASSAPPGPGYYRVTCFVHNDLIVEIDMTCDVGLQDATQGAYDHLLQTFALLD
jgi:hypothetical protein